MNLLFPFSEGSHALLGPMLRFCREAEQIFEMAEGEWYVSLERVGAEVCLGEPPADQTPT